MNIKHIRNFSIIAHIDHGKSTLADRLLEATNTIEKRKMKDQVLDQMELERERGITIKLAPVQMKYFMHKSQLDRGLTQTETQTSAETDLLYGDLTYKIRGAVFAVRKALGLGHKESVYHRALAEEFNKCNIQFQTEMRIPIMYNGKSVGIYQPDFVVDDKIILELKALPEIGKPQQEQIWSYVKGSSYRLGLLVNFSGTDVDIRRVVYDTARNEAIPRFSASSLRESAGDINQMEQYMLNLIDTPGHIDFSYEVSRALKAVEGAILLVDSTQGVQAQTLSVLQMAREVGLVIIPVLSKVDSSAARIPEVKEEIMRLLGCAEEDVLETSGKTGQGVEDLLSAIITRIPPPKEEFAETESARAFVFDFSYSTHKGIVVFVKIWDGAIKKGDALSFVQANEDCVVLETGIFAPEQTATAQLSRGEIGYIVTGLKRARIAAVGDTLTRTRAPLPALSGYKKPQPVVWASVYTESQNDFHALSQALARLQLEDPAFSYEEETSGIMGRGFRCGFLGMLHAEIITERLKREFNLPLVVATPSITYRIIGKDGKERMIYSPALFPDHSTYEKVFEPWVNLHIIMPQEYIGHVVRILHDHEAVVGATDTWGMGRVSMSAEMPLRELMRNFFDELKSVSSGYASLSYEITGEREANVTRLDIFVADEPVAAFTRVVSTLRVQEEAEKSVERLFGVLPRQMFVVKIQGRALGRIISSRTLSAFRKDVTGYLYGGDITRKMKLLEKQKRGKKKMKAGGSVDIPPEVFLKMMRSGE